MGHESILEIKINLYLQTDPIMSFAALLEFKDPERDPDDWFNHKPRESAHLNVQSVKNMADIGC